MTLTICGLINTLEPDYLEELGGDEVEFPRNWMLFSKQQFIT